MRACPKTAKGQASTALLKAKLFVKFCKLLFFKWKCVSMNKGIHNEKIVEHAGSSLSQTADLPTLLAAKWHCLHYAAFSVWKWVGLTHRHTIPLLVNCNNTCDARNCITPDFILF